MHWKPEWDEVLKTLLAQNKSCADVAAEISAIFGISVSRNAVIGRGHRLGVKSNLRSGDGRRIAAVAPTPKPPPRPPKPQHVPVQFACDDAGLRVADVAPLNLRLLDLKPLQCRWPYGDGSDRDPYRFCGHPMFDGSSYCIHHAFLSTGEGTEAERRAHRGIAA